MMTPAWCEPHPDHLHPVPRDGRRWCGPLERVLRRLWSPGIGPPRPECVAAVDDLAGLETGLAARLATALSMVWIGDRGIGYAVEDPAGGIGRAVTLRTSPSPARTLVAHALCDLDGLAATPEWRAITRRCLPVLRTRPCPQDWWAQTFALRTLDRIAAALDGDLPTAETVTAYHHRVAAGYPTPPPLPVA